jgi:hypothetical protein
VDIAIAVVICVIAGIISVRPRDLRYYASFARRRLVVASAIYLAVHGLAGWGGQLLAVQFLAPSRIESSAVLRGLTFGLLGLVTIRANSRIIVGTDVKPTAADGGVEDDFERYESEVSPKTVIRATGSLIGQVISWLALWLDDRAEAGVRNCFEEFSADYTRDGPLAEHAYGLHARFPSDTHHQAATLRGLQKLVTRLLGTDRDSPDAHQARASLREFCIKVTIAQRCSDRPLPEPVTQ